ncbi:MAG: protease modulator HflC [Gammaproteobacteria bacterium]|nr:protease modulator HflC [Gammaproteobacteria bacterium]MYD76387.1 protease modulator HflC [Gammaproteobacteria bacterium]MYJ52956.1 protease modulator HflC [Gammaproteobacteria bacterium]
MTARSTLFLVLLAIAGALAVASAYYVDEREKAIVFKFGEIVKSDVEPGLHWKVPFINNVRYFDARVQTLDADPQRYLTVEKKNLSVDSFVKWKIRDVYLYYTRLRGLKSNARSRLDQRVNDSLRQEFGKRTVQEVISGDRALIMEVVQKAMNEEAATLGIEIIDVRLKRVDLEEAISQQVYQRMSAERERVAKELRAQGEEEAEKIRADADKEREILLANADREAQIVRGEGDATATALFAGAFGRDREFYALYRSLNAYRDSFSTKQDLMIVDPSSEFFRYFKQPDPTPSP